MGHKVHPRAFRLGKITNWNSRWLNKKRYRNYLEQDTKLRCFIEEKLKTAAIEKVVIERSANLLNIIIFSGRPGLIIGRGGTGIEELKSQLEKLIKDKIALKLEIQEVKNPEASASLVAQMVAEQLEKRVSWRRVLKQTLDRVIANKEVEGVKIALSGRLGGAEMSRKEWLSRGKIPAQTIRANIDFGSSSAYTTYGVVGVKVWIYKGEVFEGEEKEGEI